MPPQLLAWEASAWITTGTLAALLWLVLFIFLGIKTLPERPLGDVPDRIVLPIFWIIGALIPARR